MSVRVAWCQPPWNRNLVVAFCIVFLFSTLSTSLTALIKPSLSFIFFSAERTDAQTLLGAAENRSLYFRYASIHNKNLLLVRHSLSSHYSSSRSAEGDSSDGEQLLPISTSLGFLCPTEFLQGPLTVVFRPGEPSPQEIASRSFTNVVLVSVCNLCMRAHLHL